MAIGAGVGALKGAVTGGDPLKEALIGGALGGLTGGAGQALGLGGAAAGTGSAVAGTAGKAAVDLGTKAAFEASMGLPSTAFLESGGSLATALGGTTKAMGLVPTASGTLINPEYYSNILGNQVYTGGEGVLSNAISQFTPSMADLKQYATVDNLIGAGNVMNKFQPKPMSPAPQGRIIEGQPMKAGLGQGGVEGLLAELQKRQQQQYQPISLL